jgi:hypothetical protein
MHRNRVEIIYRKSDTPKRLLTSFTVCDVIKRPKRLFAIGQYSDTPLKPKRFTIHQMCQSATIRKLKSLNQLVALFSFYDASCGRFCKFTQTVWHTEFSTPNSLKFGICVTESIGVVISGLWRSLGTFMQIDTKTTKYWVFDVEFVVVRKPTWQKRLMS